MAKKQSNGTTEGMQQGETVAGYFRRVFAENPMWIDSRSNDQLFVRWLKDHPGQTEVPEKVRQNLSNIKSTQRKQSRERPMREKPHAANHIAESPPKYVRGLDRLEEQIDECLTLAKNLDREGLDRVIALLRRARNEVVWKMGETLDR